MSEFLKSKFGFGVLLTAIAVVYAVGGLVDVMGVDAAQYASMSLEMMQTGEILQVQHRYQDYLDKPPLLFWLSSLSFWLFGVSNFAYKLPSILFSLLGIFSTYKLGKKLYDEETGRLASLILGSCQAMILINNDVRTDTILTGALIFALWQWILYFEDKKWGNLVFGSVGVALAMLSKGPIGLMMPVLALGSEIVIKGQWRKTIDPKLLMAIFLIAIMLLPMCIGLYHQHGMEGLKFYFWTQSFGRLTGENVWANDEGPLFFIETFLWSFLPWTLFGGVAVLQRFFFLFRDGSSNRKSREYYTIGGITLVFIAMSLSKYKLQHYVFIAFPLIAILTGSFMVRIMKHSIWSSIQNVIAGLILILISVLSIYSFDPKWWAIALLVVAFLGFGFVILKGDKKAKLWLPSFLVYITVGLIINGAIYPQLMSYQATSVAGKWMKNKGLTTDQVRAFGDGGHAMDFYSGFIVKWDNFSDFDAIRSRDTLFVFTNPKKYEGMSKNYGPADSVLTIPSFSVQFMKLPFLNPERRHEVLKEKLILMYYPFKAETASHAIKPEPISSALSSMSNVGI
ncbi:MAG: 4-amino-4-deoxy-L-arabinose transferase-like glycosyltransferase [Oceanospirillaceae bacterium]|jgi:4-amino-4-deoxy-L-arabinose transferase-like glycosyltransferase